MSLLRVRGVSKRFGGLQAVDAVDLEVASGHIHGLIGPNGAGKTTFFNLITGLIPADSGEFQVAGCAYQPSSVHRVVEAGIARTFQTIRLFGQMTALDNVLVGRHRHQSWLDRGALGPLLNLPSSRAAQAQHRQIALDLLARVGLADSADRVAATLSYGAQRRLEIARALATEPQLLALDEPAAGMNGAEKSALGELLLSLRDDGLTLLIIEHDMGLVQKVCNRLTVLAQGAILAEGAPAEVVEDVRVIEAYLGRSRSTQGAAE